MKTTQLAAAMLAPLLVAQPAAVGLPSDAHSRPNSATQNDTAHDVTSPVEAQRVDSVDVSDFAWGDCKQDNPDHVIECATLDVPMDYDEPDGAQIPLDVLRRPADDQANKRGSLFIRTGGPGYSSQRLAQLIIPHISRELLQYYDIVGLEQRGVGESLKTQCYPDRQAQQENDWARFYPAISDKRLAAQYLAHSRAHGAACAQDPDGLPYNMSTAQAARDLDVVRRAVGDEKLTFLGFSYGSVVGQQYASIFPDRVRAIAGDGVIYAGDWVGEPGDQHKNYQARVKSADGSRRAVLEILARCDAAPKLCVAAQKNDSEPTATEKFHQIMEYFNQDVSDTWDDREHSRFLFLNHLIGALYEPVNTGEQVAAMVLEEWELRIRQDGSTAQSDSKSELLTVDRDMVTPEGDRSTKITDDNTGGDPYDHAADTFDAVRCGDVYHPRRITDNYRQAVAMSADNEFNYMWAFQSVECARDSWKAKDDDRYMGPFDQKTSGPLLFVGNEWDPVTHVEQAKKAAQRYPNAELLFSDSWGHTSFFTSRCAKDAINGFLLEAKATPGVRCTGDYQPFREASQQQEAETALKPEDLVTRLGPTGPPSRAAGHHKTNIT